MTKILITRSQAAGGEENIDRLKAAYPSVEWLSGSTPEEVRERVVDVDAVLGGQLTNDDALAAKKLRWMHSSGVGVNLRSVPALVRSDVVVTNPRGAPSATMAEHAFAMLLLLTRRLREADEYRKQKRWVLQNQPFVSALIGKTMGVMGLGSIGSNVARRAHGFEMEVIALDPRPAEPLPFVSEVLPPERLHDFLRRVDVLAICAPVNAATRGLIGPAEFELMKSSAFIVNLSRGAIVQEAGLADALKSGRIAGACLDVFETSPGPLPEDSPLWELDNVIITAHCSGRSAHTDEVRYRIVHENVGRFLKGEPLINQVDKVAVST